MVGGNDVAGVRMEGGRKKEGQSQHVKNPHESTTEHKSTPTVLAVSVFFLWSSAVSGYGDT